MIARFWEIVARFRVGRFSGVPTLFAALLETPTGDNDLSSLEFAICGAAPMPAALIWAFEGKTGVKIIEGYGLTEGACVSAVNPPGGERFAGSVGLPLPYQRMAAVVLDGEGRFQRMADIDEIGVIAINGPNVFSGYLDPRHNEGVWLDIDGESWLNTAISADGTQTDISGSRDARRSSSSEADTTSIPRSSRTRCRRTRPSP